MRNYLSRLIGPLAVGVALLAPSIVVADDDGGEDKTVSAVGETKSDADKSIARAKAATTVIEGILQDWSFAAIRGERRKQLIHSVYDIFRNEHWDPLNRSNADGKHKYVASYSRSEAENRVMDCLKVEEEFGRDPFIMVCLPVDWCETGLGRDSNAIGESVRLGASDYMNRHRFRQSPAANNQEKVKQAAVSLGADPATQKLKDFAMMFQADLVCSIKGQIKLEKWPADSAQAEAGFYGYLRAQLCVGRLYDKGSDTILAEFKIESTGSKKDEKDATANKIHQPWVTKDNIGEEAEKYATCIGKMIGANVAKRLFEKFYARQADVAPSSGGNSGGGTSAGPRKCPGCGDSILDGAIAKCPSCDSPLPAAAASSGGNSGGNSGGTTTPAGRQPTDRDFYELRFKGWSDTDVDLIQKAIEGKDGFSRWKEQGSTGEFHVYRVCFMGELIVKRVNESLDEVNLKSKAKVSKSGNTITIEKGGG